MTKQEYICTRDRMDRYHAMELEVETIETLCKLYNRDDVTMCIYLTGPPFRSESLTLEAELREEVIKVLKKYRCFLLKEMELA